MKQKKQLAVLVVLLLVAGVIWFLYFDHNKPMVTAQAGSPIQNYQLLSVDNPQLHNDGVDKARKTEYKSGGRNIFSRELPPPPQPKHPVQEVKTPIVPPPPPPPTVAPLPVKFFGYGTVPNGSGRPAFFTDGEDIYIVAGGELFPNPFSNSQDLQAPSQLATVSPGLP